MNPDTVKMIRAIERDYVDSRVNGNVITLSLMDRCKEAKTPYEMERECRYWGLQNLIKERVDIDNVDFDKVFEGIRE